MYVLFDFTWQLPGEIQLHKTYEIPITRYLPNTKDIVQMYGPAKVSSFFLPILNPRPIKHVAKFKLSSRRTCLSPLLFYVMQTIYFKVEV